MTTSFIINHLWQSSCFALLAGLLAFVAAQEFAEGTLLGLAERIAKISHTVRVAGEPRKCGSASSSAPGVRCGSCFPEHPRSNRATVFADSSANCSSAYPTRLGRRSRSASCGPSGFWQSRWHDAAVGWEFEQHCEPARPSNSRSPYRRSSRLARRSRASLVFCARSWFYRPSSWNT